MDYMQI